MKTALLLSVLCAAMAVTASLTCGGVPCANDEICNSDSTACKCNTSYYTKTADNPSPALTCDRGNFTILVSKCWLEVNGFNSTNITLGSPSCLAAREVVKDVAQMGIHQLVTKDCGTTSVPNATHVTYSNKLYIFSKRVPIQARKDVVMNMSCTYPLIMDNVALNITLNPIIGTTEIAVPGANANFTVNMMVFTDDTFSIALSSSDELLVESFIYVSVNIPDLDINSFKLKVVKIYATGDGSDTTPYNLLVDGCPTTGTDLTADLLSVVYNGNATEARFKLKVFKITDSPGVRLFMDLVVCKATDVCGPVCPPQSRSGKSGESGATVSVVYQPSERFADASSASGFSMPWTLPSLLFSWILVKLM